MQFEDCPQCGESYRAEPSWIVWELWDGKAYSCECGYNKDTAEAVAEINKALFRIIT